MSSSATSILFVTHLYIQYSYTIILVLGLVGNSFNVIVFIHLKPFRERPGAFYMVVESLADAGVLLVGLAPRVLVEIFNFDPGQTLLIWCKLRIPISQWCSLMALSAVNLAVIDLYFSTNFHVHLRQLSTLRLARHLTVIMSIIWFLYNIPFIVFYDIKVAFGCLLKNPELARYYSFFHLLIVYGLLPFILTTTFSILAYRNVRRLRRRNMSNVRRRFDRQLTAMILARVVLGVFCLLPFILQRFYIANTRTNPNELLRVAIEQLVTSINVSLSYLNVSVSQKSSSHSSS